MHSRSSSGVAAEVWLASRLVVFGGHAPCPWEPTDGICYALQGETCLALPKLNLQFLTAHDYLLRNFSLFRLEATYEIREDLADVLSAHRARLVRPALFLLINCCWCNPTYPADLRLHGHCHNASFTIPRGQGGW